MPVVGDSVTTSDLPAPGYWVMPAMGPGEMMMSFSGSFHLVLGLMACHKYHRPKPRPPVNRSFICAVIFFSLIFSVERSMCSERSV